MIEMSASYAIEEYLQGLFDYDLPESAIKAVLYKRNITPSSPMSSLEDADGIKKRELAEADLCMWLASSSSTSRGEYESDGGWQHQKSAKNVVDRNGFISRANAIYQRYNETSSVSTKGKMVIRNV